MHSHQNKSFCSPPYSRSTCYYSKVTYIVAICSHIVLLYACRFCLAVFILEDLNLNPFSLEHQQLPKDCLNLCSSGSQCPSDAVNSHFLLNI